ncbi:hypothetical protein Ae201684P_011473 [Aphanomyces euteiches]|nr:hypothetical protein Ae201684P_011473 [Aphanomyces euteiches]
MDESKAAIALDAILARESLATMQELFHALTLDDLCALASFPSHPHRTVHLLLAMVYLILHDNHDGCTTTFYMLTWAFLRENLLARSKQLFQQLHVHHHRRFQVTSPVVVHLCLLYLQEPAFRIDALRRVSVIAAALASWVILCFTTHIKRQASPLSRHSRHRSMSTVSQSCRMVIRLHSHPFELCLARIQCSSNEVIVSLVSPAGAALPTITLRRSDDRLFHELFASVASFPRLAFMSWMQQIFQHSLAIEPWIQLPARVAVRLYFVLVTPPHVIGLGLLIVDATMTLRACRLAFQAHSSIHDTVFYYRGTRVPRHMETKLDARRILPIGVLIHPRSSSFSSDSLKLLFHLQCSLAATQCALPTVKLPIVQFCELPHMLIDDETTKVQLQSLLQIWTAKGYVSVLEMRRETLVKQLDLELLDPPQYIDPFKRTNQERKYYNTDMLPKLNFVKTQLDETKMKQLSIPEKSASQPGDQSSKRRRCIPHFAYISLEQIHASVAGVRYRCGLAEPLPEDDDGLGNIEPGTILRLESGDELQVETPWIKAKCAFEATSKRIVHSVRSMVWSVVDVQFDKRPQWLHDIQLHVRHLTIEFKWSPLKYDFFRVPLAYSIPEQLLEATIWSRHVNWTPYVEKTQCNDMIDARFADLCASFPSASDSVKFSKFIRDCNITAKNLPMGSLDGVFHRHAMMRFQMDLEGFRAAILLVVQHLNQKTRVPRFDDPCLEFFLVYMIMSPSMRSIWEQTIDSYRLAAKMKALDALAMKICAVTRIQATYRGSVIYSQFKDHWVWVRRRRRAATCIISCFKMLNCMRRLEELKRLEAIARALEAEREAKRRKEEAKRLFLLRCHVNIQVWARYQMWRKQRVCRLYPEWFAHKQRMRTRKRLFMTRLACQVGGRLLLVSVFRSHIDQAKDPKFHMELYNPVNSTTFDLDVHESTMQEICASSIDHNEADMTNLRSRLIAVLHRVYFNNIIRRFKIHPSETRSAHGRELSRRACRTSNKYVVASIFLNSYQIELVKYTPSSCVYTKSTMDVVFVYRVLQANLSSLTWQCCGLAFDSSCSDLMQCRRVVGHALSCPFNTNVGDFQNALIRVATNGTTFPAVTTEESHTYVVEIPVDPRQPKMSPAAIAIQKMWRGYNARHLFSLLLPSNFDAYVESGHVCYYSHRTGHRFRSPPFTSYVRVAYLPPRDEWLPQYDHASIYYFNPARGVTSWFNLDSATLKVQRAFRMRRQWAIGTINLKCIVNALTFHTLTSRLSSPEELLRQALHHHTITHKFDKAINSYETLLEASPDHEPVASAGLAILLVATGRPPRQKNLIRANILLEKARQLDADLTATRALEDTCFRWAAMLAPTNAMTLAIYAVFIEEIVRDIDRAEALYRRSLAISPDHEATLENYSRLVQERRPSGLYAFAGPGSVAHHRAYVLSTHGAWQHLHDRQTDSRFWYHLTTKQLRWNAPEELSLSDDS